MSRGIVIASVFAAAAAIAAFSMRGVAATPATGVSQWQPGLNYTVLGYPLPSTLPKGKVEVNEVFWYGCSHCYALDPTLESWNKSKAAYIEFVRIPVIWGPSHRQHAKLFYTLRKLHRDDLHAKVFDTIHRDGKPLMASTDQEARAIHLAFLKENGVTEQQFNDVYDSADIEKQLDLAERLTAQFEVASVPTLIVAGAYSTSVSQAGGEPQLLALINDLAAREQRR
jgi:protein dithiol oxidoreductase (disulfide-forming)